VLLGILENAFFERNLRSRIDGKRQWKMLLQWPDCFYGWILVARLRLWERFTLGVFPAFGLLGFFLSPQAVT